MTPRDYGAEQRCGRLASLAVAIYLALAFGAGLLAWAYSEPLT